MKKYQTEFKVVEGVRTYFEKQINELSKQGWIWCGSLAATHIPNPSVSEIHYSLLMSRTTEIEDVQQK